jgi:hypothetical protein
METLPSPLVVAQTPIDDELEEGRDAGSVAATAAALSTENTKQRLLRTYNVYRWQLRRRRVRKNEQQQKRLAAAEFRDGEGASREPTKQNAEKDEIEAASMRTEE